ncbi:MAG TPA: hypothetical protein PLG15_07295 [Candidatus Gastranaerophilaceae bacterium]|nr:hypothetical protein [Candidatus Gastranaerophilaceae bacterium]HPT42173.1 hypothetical protein [Candidatus Gastranaerophilaceae bacterium]
MRTDFKEYLEKKNAQKAIDKIAKQFKDKKVVLYGAGFMASDLLRNYDFSRLNIIGIADIKFQDDTEGDFYGYPKLGPYDLLETEFDLLLITTYDDEPVRDFFNDDLFEGEEINFKVKTLVKMSLWDYIKQIMNA